MANKVTITCKLEPENAKRLDALAKAIGMTRSELVSNCIALGLKQGEYVAERLKPPTSANYIRLDFNRDEYDQAAEEQLEDLWKRNYDPHIDI